MRLVKAILLLVSAVLVLVLGAAYWLVGTAGGTRWLLARADGRLPDELVLGEGEGTLLHGIRMDSLEWRGETLHLRAVDINLNIELLPLASRHLVVESLAASELELRIPDRKQPQPSGKPFIVDLPVDITARDVAIERLRYTQRSFDRVVRDVSLAGSLKGPRLNVRRIGWRSDWLDLDASGSARLAAPFDINADAAWRLHDVDGMAVAGSLHLDGDRQVYKLEHRLIEPLAIATAGTAEFRADGLYADLSNNWQDLAWDTPRGAIRSAGGSLVVRGQLDEFAVALDARVGLDGRPQARLELDGDVRRSGTLVIDLGWDLDSISTSYLQPDLRGELAANGRIAGAIGDDGTNLDIRIEELQGTINDHPILGAASARLAADELTVAESWIRQDDNVVRMRGTVTEPLDVDIEIELDDLSELAPQTTGRVTGRAAVRGAYALPTADAELSGENLAFGGFEISSATVSFVGNADRHTISARVSAYDSGLIASATGQFRDATWSTTIGQLELSGKQLGTWVAGSASTVLVSPERTRIAPACLERSGGAGTACLSGWLSGGDSEFDLAIDGFPVAALPLGLPPDVEVSGTVNARAHTSSLAGRPVVASAELELVDTALGATYMDEQVSIAISRAEARADIEEGHLESSLQFELADGAGRASANLRIPDLAADTRLLDGDGNVVFRDFSLFAILVPGISKPTGELDGEFTLSGSAAAPDLVGTIRLADGAFGVRQTGISVSDIDLELAQLEPGRIRLHGKASSGGGTLNVEGFSSIGTGAGMRAEINLTGDDFELARLPDWQVSASPSITAVFDAQATRITGDLAIPRADVTLREAPVTAERPSSDVVVHRQESVATTDRRPIELDVRASLGDKVSFSGFGLTSRLTGSVRFRGGGQVPVFARGKVSLVDGRYEAYGQELAIERGELIFNGPLDNPLLDIRAVREVGDVVAGIQLSGTPKRLQSDVFSDPSMPDADILSYLLTGRALSETTSADDGEVLNKAAFALGLSGAGLVTSQIRTELGLETLTISGTGDASKLVAGKRLSDRLLVEYGYGLIDKLGTLLLRYQLNENLVLESRTGTVSTFDVVYRRRKK